MVAIIVPGRFGPMIVGGTAGGGAWSGPSSGLTHRWPMDAANVSGTTITDVVAALNGTASGAGVSATTGPSGASNAARAFDGASNVSLPSNPVTIGSANSLFWWAKVTNISNAASDGRSQRFVAFNTDGNNYVVTTNDETVPGGFDVEYTLASANIGKRASAAALSNNTWAHLGYTFNGTATVTLYVNGSSIGTTTPNGGSSVSGNYFGARDASTGFLTGALSQMVVYDHVLSGADITQLYGAF